VLDKSSHESGNGAAAKAEPRPEDAGALHGVRVLDLTQFEAGTSCTQFLGFLGAEVIKVESPSKGDPGRNTGPKGDSFYFLMLNANKRSVTLDLKHEEGRALLRSMIEKCDVFVENFAPGTIDRLGFGWDVVREINPRIIYAQIKGFAPDGRYAKLLCFDAVAQSAGGSLSATGETDGRPLRPGYHMGDTGTGVHCLVGILAALYQRQFTGRGQRIEVTMQEAVMNFGRAGIAAATAKGEAAHRHGNGTNNLSIPCDIFPCKGGGPNDYAFITCSRQGNEHWDRLLKVIGREDLIGDPRYANTELRDQHRDEVISLVTNWTRERDKEVVMSLLGNAGVPSSAVFDTKELMEDPDLRKRGAVVTVKHPVRGEYAMPGWPVRMSDSNVPIEASPLFGADTDKIFGELLGLKPEKLAELHKEKVI
jgi:formyl-CoA transferase